MTKSQPISRLVLVAMIALGGLTACSLSSQTGTPSAEADESARADESAQADESREEKNAMPVYELAHEGSVNLSTHFGSDKSQVLLRRVELLDSRCPRGAHCMVAGQVQLKIAVEQGGKTTEHLLTLPAEGGRPRGPEGAQNEVGVKSGAEELVIRLEAVEPYPALKSEVQKAEGRVAKISVRAAAES